MLLYKQITSLDDNKIKNLLLRLLKEDIPTKDLTTDAAIPKNKKGKYTIRSREKMIFCGGPVIKNAFSKKVQTNILVRDGANIQAGVDIAHIQGNVQEILKKERLILNIIQHLSGISSNTSKYASKLKKSPICILDTRKTTPGLRILEKYAVKMGGGNNHRLNLSSGVMIKDNHIVEDLKKIVYKIKKINKNIPIQLEIDSPNQITKENVNNIDAFLLDNMNPTTIKKCIKKINGLKEGKKRLFIEASGGITLKNIEKYIISGVDGISIGALTHQSTSVDIGLDKS